MRKLLHYLIGSIGIMAICLIQMPAAEAHPLGNFTINQYAGLQVRQEQIEIDYVLDMAEIPAFEEINQLDTNHNRQREPRETVEYPSQKCQEVNSHLELLVNKELAGLSVVKSAVKFPSGVGGLPTLRLTCDFQTAIELVGKNQLVEFENNSYPQRLGWREITVATKNVPIQGDFTSTSITNRLKDYPNKLLSSPLDQRSIAFTLNPVLTSNEKVISSPVQSPNRSVNDLTGRNNDLFTNLITQPNDHVLTLLVALAIAFVWGGLHALSPGHGKTVVGAYLVGSRSNAQHAIFLGLIVTITHTGGILALGLLTLGTSQFILTEQLFPWLSVLSGCLIVLIGINLLISRLKSTNNEHSHDHSHGHSHDHNHDHSHLPHSHGLSRADGKDVKGSSVQWSNLLLLGISGGLLPCPSALVVLLSAISLGKIGFGLALVSAFSLGLAAVLTGIGLILVYAKERFKTLPIQIPKFRLLPVASALCITLIGIGITTQALLGQRLN